MLITTPTISYGRRDCGSSPDLVEGNPESSVARPGGIAQGDEAVRTREFRVEDAGAAREHRWRRVDPLGDVPKELFRLLGGVLLLPKVERSDQQVVERLPHVHRQDPIEAPDQEDRQ